MGEVMGYFYVIEHIGTGKKYAGCRYAKEADASDLLTPDGYKTSSMLVQKMIKDEGLSAFRVVDTVITDDAIAYEAKFFVDNDCIKSEAWLNISSHFGENGVGSVKYNEYIKEVYGVDYVTQIRKECPYCNEQVSIQNFTKYHGEMCKSYNPNRKVNTHLIGVSKTEECKLKQKGTEYYNPFTLKVTRVKEHLGEVVEAGMIKGNPNKQHMWVTNGKENKRVPRGNIPYGYRKGRAMDTNSLGQFTRKVA